MTIARTLLASATAAVALGSTSCGSGNPGGPDATWVQVTEKTACEALVPAYCVGLYGFTVTSDGRYTVGPADGGAKLEGSLADKERVLIASDADALATNLGAAEVCDSSGTVPGVGDSVDLTDSRNVVTRVYALGLTTCYRGGRAQATQLHKDLAGLMAQYYPRPFPQ